MSAHVPSVFDVIDDAVRPYGVRLTAEARARNGLGPDFESLVLPTAQWSGEICGVKVYVLSNGQRVVDAESFEQWFSRGESSTPEACDTLAQWVAGAGDAK